MKTVKHYSFEMDVTEDTLEYGTTSLSYHVEKFELGDIKKTIVTLPKSELVSLVEREIGTKSLKWFTGLYSKLEKTILAL